MTSDIRKSGDFNSRLAVAHVSCKFMSGWTRQLPVVPSSLSHSVEYTDVMALRYLAALVCPSTFKHYVFCAYKLDVHTKSKMADFVAGCFLRHGSIL